MASMYSSRCIWLSDADDTSCARNTTNSGWMRKMSGKMAIATTTDRLRRYSRSSLWKIAQRVAC